jgi:hypothetical protein
VDNITKIALSITTIALVATLVVNGSGTAKVITAGGSAFSNSIRAAQKG